MNMACRRCVRLGYVRLGYPVVCSRASDNARAITVIAFTGVADVAGFDVRPAGLAGPKNKSHGGFCGWDVIIFSFFVINNEMRAPSCRPF